MCQPKPIKYLLLILLFLLPAQIVAANAIDDLKTDSDVLNLLVKLDTNFLNHGKPYIEVLPTDKLIPTLKCSDIARQWDIKTWEKVDFNNDKLTDLLVTVSDAGSAYVYAIIDQPSGGMKLIRITQGLSHGCQIAKPIWIGNKQMLRFYAESSLYNETTKSQDWTRTDTLIFLYGDFVEFNNKPDNYQVKSVYIETSGCFGTCPVFKLKISKDGEATYNAKSYNPKNGNYRGSVSLDRLAQIKSLINYIGIKMLKDFYSVNWTDDQTALIQIEFTDGTVKTVNDYGMIGSFGLSRLYNLLFDLRRSEKWDWVSFD
jgi:hypothetical protein